MNKISAKQREKRLANGERFITSTIARKTESRTPLKKKARPAKETTRIFGPKKRRDFVKTLPCCVTGFRHTDYDPIDNAHVCKDESKGLSRRAGYRCIAPMKHSIHMLLHSRPDLFRQRFPFADAAWFEQSAALTEKLWLQSGLVRVDG